MIKATERLMFLFLGMIAGLFIALLANEQGWLDGSPMMWVYFGNALVASVLITKWLNDR
jgi:hypothetical protein